MILKSRSVTRATLVACGCCAVLTEAHAETVAQTVGDIDWNAAMWGDPPAVPVAGNDYVATSGMDRFRIAADGTSSTFGGDSITIVENSRALIKLQNGATATLNGDLTLAGGGMSFGPNGGPHDGTLDVENLIVTGSGSDITPSSGVGTFTIDGVLSGDGDLRLLVVSGNNLRTVSFTEVGDYTGNLTVAAPIRLDFGSDHTFAGGLTLEGAAILSVDQTLTFSAGKLVADGAVVPPGTYSGASLYDLGFNFEDGGGTLIVSGSFPDTDGDGLPDFYEDMIIDFDPDDDVDGYDDVAGPNDLPHTTDFDGDGRTDAEEWADGVVENETDPTNPDVDGDGLLDGAEFAGTNNAGVSTGFGPTDPFEPDSDGDGFSDGVEVRYGSNPNDADVLPGESLPIVNGGFESPALPVFGEGLGVAGGSVPGWTATTNDFYVFDYFPTPGMHNPAFASEGFQFATAVRTAPEPDLEPADLEGGIDASMGMRQDVDVSSFATQIDAGARTLLLDYDWRDSDEADQGVVTISFLDASGGEIGRRSVFATTGTIQQWISERQAAFPPAGTRTVRVTVEAHKVGTGSSSIRNVHFDNFSARLVHFDADNDQLPDLWETAHGLDPDDPGDADVSSDGDTLTNLEEFLLGTDPTLADTDGDGINDDDEVASGTDPLDPNSPAPEIKLDDMIVTADGAGGISRIEFIFSGLNPARTYYLRRSTDLVSFPETVDTFQPLDGTESFHDSDPPAGRAFYRLEAE